MNVASPILLLLSVLGVPLVKTLGRTRTSTFTPMKTRYCGRIKEVPARGIKVATSSSTQNGGSYQVGTALNPRSAPRMKVKQDEGDMDCSKQDMLVGGTGRRAGKYIVVALRSCPSVQKIILQLRSLAFIKAPRHLRFTCERFHDTVVIFRHRSLYNVTMELRGQHGDTFSLAWNYEMKENNTSRWLHGNTTIDTEVQEKKQSQVIDNFARDGRSRTVKKEKPTTMETPAEASDEECGNQHSCVRFDTPGCKHQECEYFLTYKFVNHTRLVLEMSGKSDGWIALGLSSDKKMGGDEVIACKRTSPHGHDLEAFSGWISLPHSRPKQKSVENLQLVKHHYKDGHIYCKIIISVSMNDVGGDTSLDLTASWYQMYARGEIDHNGAMLRHSEIPPTSKEKISMLIPVRVDSSGVRRATDRNASSKLTRPSLESCYSTLFLLLIALKLGLEI